MTRVFRLMGPHPYLCCHAWRRIDDLTRGSPFLTAKNAQKPGFGFVGVLFSIFYVYKY